MKSRGTPSLIGMIYKWSYILRISGSTICYICVLVKMLIFIFTCLPFTTTYVESCEHQFVLTATILYLQGHFVLMAISIYRGLSVLTGVILYLRGPAFKCLHSEKSKHSV